MNLSELDEAARQAMLLRIREDPSCASALKRLQGEVLQIDIVGLAEYRLAFREGSVALDPGAQPSLRVAGAPKVMDAILEGRLDPLVAILTRRLKARIDPVRGPLLRQILCSGLGRTASDMGWDKVIGKLHFDPEPPAVPEAAAPAEAAAALPEAAEGDAGSGRGTGAARPGAAPEFTSDATSVEGSHGL